MPRPTWAEIDLDALIRNYRQLQTLICPSEVSDDRLRTAKPRIIAVVKADAYGHGAAAVARALASEGVSAFAVAIVEEGLQLREAGISQDILVMEGAWPGQEEEAVRNRLLITVFSDDSVRRLDQAARKAGTPARVHIKVDTGMTRLGAPWDSTAHLLHALQSAEMVGVAGTYSHFAASEEADGTFTREQIRRFEVALEAIRRCGLDPGELHFSNSGGMLHCESLRGLSARPGIALYGYPPAPERSPVRLEPVLSLKTRIGRVYTLPPGETVGYGRRFVAARTTRVATLPIGYADGYRRDLSEKGRVIIRDRYVDLVGRVSMDLITIDVTDLPEVQAGEDVILLGSSRSCRVDAASWADLAGTIPYEILTGFGPRVPRIYR